MPLIPQISSVITAIGAAIKGDRARLTALELRRINYFNAGGAISTVTKKWTATVTPTTANGNVIDISSAGFTSILTIQVIAAKNSAVSTDCPQVSIKSYTNSQIVVNIVSGSAGVIGALGSTINGTIFPASVTGITLLVMVEGY